MTLNCKYNEVFNFTPYEIFQTSHKVTNIPLDINVLVNCANLCCFLQIVRNIYKNPIIVNSGYRSEQLNRIVGGSSGSKHIQGLAVDIRPSNPTKEALNELMFTLTDIKDCDFMLGYGTYMIDKILRHSTFIHVQLKIK